MLEKLFTKTSIPLMKHVLDITGLRQRVIASNISNVSTPGYQPKEVDFHSSLQNAVANDQLKGKMDHGRHMPIGHMNESRGGLVVKQRGEKVILEKEMARSAENQILYSAAIKIISGQFKALKGCIRGRF